MSSTRKSRYAVQCRRGSAMIGPPENGSACAQRQGRLAARRPELPTPRGRWCENRRPAIRRSPSCLSILPAADTFGKRRCLKLTAEGGASRGMCRRTRRPSMSRGGTSPTSSDRRRHRTRFSGAWSSAYKQLTYPQGRSLTAGDLAALVAAAEAEADAKRRNAVALTRDRAIRLQHQADAVGNTTPRTPVPQTPPNTQQWAILPPSPR